MVGALLFTACSNQKEDSSQAEKAEQTSQISSNSQNSRPAAKEERLINKNEGNRNHFKLAISLDHKNHKLKVSQKLYYYNNSNDTLDKIVFNMVPQAFSKNGGGVEVKDITVGKHQCKLEKVKETVYSMKLPAQLPAHEKVLIQMEYQVKIPNIKNRFGYQDKVYNLGNFIVTPAVYGEKGWAVQSYVDIGDAFYTDIADYEVAIKVPEGFVVAATGKEVSKGLYSAESVRDFAFCASPSFKTITEKEDNTDITVFYNDKLDKTAVHTMEVARKSLKLYSRLFGKYPYDTLSIVINGLTGGVNGMEYPTLVMISPDINWDNYKSELGFDSEDSASANFLENDNATCHEIAHQWFYGIVGNDQISEAWLDEGFCRFSEYLYQKEYESDYSQTAKNSGYMTKDRIDATLSCVKDNEKRDEGTDLGKSLYYWVDTDPMGYGSIYDKGACLLYEMEQQMGEKEFQAALKEYVRTFAYSFVTRDSFKEYWNSKANFDKLFDLYF